MRLFKLRAMSNQNEFDRVKQIIETGKFWCSKFYKMNDPMEGVYYHSSQKSVNEIFSEKNRYKICSFSGEKAFKNPAMWGYYAGGFYGVAIEIEDMNSTKPVVYSDTPQTENVEIILTTKLKKWGHEFEHRFLQDSECNSFEIGEIKHIYIGNPYHDVSNLNDILNKHEKLEQYQKYVDELKKILKCKGIGCSIVKVECGEVVSCS